MGVPLSLPFRNKCRVKKKTGKESQKIKVTKERFENKSPQGSSVIAAIGERKQAPKYPCTKDTVAWTEEQTVKPEQPLGLSD